MKARTIIWNSRNMIQEPFSEIIRPERIVSPVTIIRVSRAELFPDLTNQFASAILVPYECASAFLFPLCSFFC